MASARRQIQRFEVREQLGEGGMGAVFRAWDPQLERDVAIKVLAEGLRDPALELSPHETLDLRGTAPPKADDLLSEARMMARLSHPNVLPVYEVGLADGVVFVVMEHIDGSNLRQWLEQPREPPAILAVFAQAGAGLAAAHARGIIHRDFKPENVLIGSDGRARVADFGLSQLMRPARPAFVRIDDGRGTPRYMAPELWRGDPATTASDVFAFCTAFGEALGDRGVSLRLRALIDAGIAEDPARRPDLATVLGAIEGKVRSRWWLAAGAGGASAAAIVAVVATRSARPSCDGDPRVWSGRWGDAERARVMQLATRDDRARTYIPKFVASLDDDRRAIDGELRATCLARQAGELGEAQARARASCAERRAIEIGALARWLPVTKLDLGDAENKVNAVPPTMLCATLATPPLPADRAPLAALYDRYNAVWDIPAYPRRVAPLVQVERDAAALGEVEMEIRAAIAIGVYQRSADDLAAAAATLQRAYRRALDVHATDYALLALVERSNTLGRKGDTAEARSLTELAATQVDKPEISPRIRALVYSAQGSALIDRGDYLAAIATLQKGLDTIANDGHRMNVIELGIRFRLIDALLNVEERVPAGVKLARDTVEFTRTAWGEHYADYGTALSKLAYGLTVSSDPASALVYRRQAIAVMSESLPPDHSLMIQANIALGADLYGIGEFEEARRIWQSALDESEHNESLRAERATLFGALGQASFQLGRFDEGLQLVQRGVDETAAEYGRDHHWVQLYRREVASYQMELGRFDDAARTIATLEESIQRKAESRTLDLARLHGMAVAELDLLRGKPHDAEQLTRAAIGGWDELHGDKADRASLWLLLGWELVEQKHWADARAALELAKAFARTTPPDEAARIEAQLARVDAAQGHRAEAIAEATHASEVLAKFPGAILARKDLAALLASLR